MEQTYEEFINNILETRGRHGCGYEYHEKHHIIPKCMGGNDDDVNLIDLFAREHFIAHKLLALENPNNNSLIYAWWMICHCTKNKNGEMVRCAVNEEEYEEAKIAYSIVLSDTNKNRVVSDITRKKISKATIGENNPFYGKRHSDETKDKISKANRGRIHTDEQKKKISESLKGRVFTEYTKTKISESLKGRTLTEEHKNKLSESANSCCVNQFTLDGKLINEFSSINSAAKATNINASNIGKACKHKYKTAGGFIWEYADITTNGGENNEENGNF